MNIFLINSSPLNLFLESEIGLKEILIPGSQLVYFIIVFRAKHANLVILRMSAFNFNHHLLNLRSKVNEADIGLSRKLIKIIIHFALAFENLKQLE